MNVWKTIYHHGLYAMGGVVYQHKGFRALISTLTAPESIDSQTGKIYYEPITLKFNASYSIDNWNFGFAYYNPYKAKGRGEIDLGIFQQHTASRKFRISDNYGSISVSYRFNYGKKKHKFDETEVIDVNQTTISK